MQLRLKSRSRSKSKENSIGGTVPPIKGKLSETYSLFGSTTDNSIIEKQPNKDTSFNLLSPAEPKPQREHNLRSRSPSDIDLPEDIISKIKDTNKGEGNPTKKTYIDR